MADAPLGSRVALALALLGYWRPSGSRVRAFLRSVLTSFLALGATLWILPPIRGSGPLSILALALVLAGVSALLRPLLFAIAVLTGPLGLLLLGIVTQAVILDVALAVTPGVHSRGALTVLLGSWLVAVFVALINWLFDSGTQEAFFAQLQRQALWMNHRLRGQTERPGGLLVVQLDGLGENALRQAVTAGAVPTLSRWLRSGTHVLVGWHTGLPSTTPASQAALFYGDNRHVPGFRWFDKDTARVIVANRPNDAAEIERRISTGDGLLADGGVSVSNLFAGDASLRLLTMSDPVLPAPRSTRGFTSFVTARGGLSQSMVVFLAVMLTELQQSRRQRKRNVQPRVTRGGLFALLRAVTTVLLRDLNVTMVVEQMVTGAPIIYVNFLDYDEVAHHAGPTRPESVRTLDGLDRVVGFLNSIEELIDPDYEVVVLSDHGQAQGSTFQQLAGASLEELIHSLSSPETERPVSSAIKPVGPAERWGPATMLVTGAARSPRRRTAFAGRLLLQGRLGQFAGNEPVADPIVVCASGSLAHIYLQQITGRATQEQMDLLHPELIAGLARHSQIGVVVVRSAESGLLAYGGKGWRGLDRTTLGAGVDPMLDYGPDAARHLCNLDAKSNVGDIVLLGRHSPGTDEVVAFEELVGSHGGLGGDQTSAVLIHPAHWSNVPDELSGVGVYELLKQRSGLLHSSPPRRGTAPNRDVAAKPSASGFDR